MSDTDSTVSEAVLEEWHNVLPKHIPLFYILMMVVENMSDQNLPQVFNWVEIK